MRLDRVWEIQIIQMMESALQYEKNVDETLFDIAIGSSEEQLLPFPLMGMQQAYWIGQQYITSMIAMNHSSRQQIQFLFTHRMSI